MKKELVEIARSFSLKKNLGNYESVDFFASQKAEVPFDIAEETSEALYEFCKKECVKSLNAYLKEKAELDNLNDPNYYPKARGEMKVFTPKPGEIEKIMNREVTYAASDREGGKIKVNKQENTNEPY